MSIAADIYFELTQAKLAPDVPFCAAPDKWREALIRGAGDADDAVSENAGMRQDNFYLEQHLAHAKADARAWQKKYEADVAAKKESVTA